jgi:hypothetical protein
MEHTFFDYKNYFQTLSSLKEFKLSQRLLFLLFTLKICKTDLESVVLSVNNQRVIFGSFFFDQEMISFYFTHAHEKIYEVIDTIEDGKLKQVLEIFAETVNFFDQLPFEHLLDDTRETRDELLKSIEKLENELQESLQKIV